MKNRIIKSKIFAAILLGTVLTTSVLSPGTAEVFAEEAAAETEAVDGAAEGAVEGEGGEAGLEGEVADPGLEGAGDPLAQGGGVTPGTILANNGLYIANTFPDSLMPVGFHRQTVAYQGQNIDLAYMDNSDMVVLAYLTDATGAIGDFYLCDTATATMSDYVRLDGGNGRFLIILDPGDNINAPTGFNKTVANINNKNVTAWSLPDGTGASDKDDKKDEDKEASNPLVLKVYAADLGLGIGAGSTDSGAGDAGAVPTDATGLPADGTGLPADGTQAADGAVVVDNSYTEGTTVDPTVAAAQAAEAAAASVVTDAAGFVKPQPTEFYLIYGIDYNGAQGFFLYDTLGQTYQRYVEIDMGENEETAKYKKSAQIRLFIIAGLILFAVVLIFIIVNMSLGSRRGGPSRRYEGDDDVEEVKRRVKSKERRSVSGGGQNRRYIGDDDYDDDGLEDEGGYGAGSARRGQGPSGYGRNAGGLNDEEDDVRYYDRQSQHTGRGVVRTSQSPQRKGVRTESRPKVRTERRYVPPENDQGYGVSDETGDMGWNGAGMDGGYNDQGNYGNGGYGDQGMGRGMDQGMNQDIDLDDDFNFDFIKPGNDDRSRR